MNTQRLAPSFAMVVAVAAAAAASPLPINPSPATVAANDNRRPAGALDHGTLTLSLRAARGLWRPEGPSGPALSIEALGETGSSLSVPAPMIRVEQGTAIHVSIRNELDAVLQVHGLCERDGGECPIVTVPGGETRDVRFAAGRSGTYHYWGTTMGAPIPFRELAGAFIVDPPGGAGVPDRVFVITEWINLSPRQIGEIMAADDVDEAFVKHHPSVTFVMNGLSWPATERLTYRLGEPVRWRVINLSTQAHPMHLHGFYFEVDSLGDGVHDRPIDVDTRHPVVTQLLPSSGTMTMTWTPEREGNWLFHCHIMHHVSPERRLPGSASATTDSHAGHDASAGMAGMIMGVTILPKSVATTAAAAVSDPPSPRKLTLVMARQAAGHETSFGFRLSGDGVAPAAPESVSSPGPALVLKRNEPVEITVVNRLGEATALHWHGIELDSYYDGVHGWSGIAGKVAPMIEPGASFVVRFTPPRAGTFMYHTHVHDERQLPLGLYGPIVILDEGETFEAATDHVVMLGRSGLDPAAPNVLIPVTPVVVNGEASPRLVWKAGGRQRVRLINITPDDILSVSLTDGKGPVAWTPVSKDGSPLPAAARVAVTAQQTIAVGETYDFEFQAPGPRSLWIEVRSTAGKWLAQGHVIVK